MGVGVGSPWHQNLIQRLLKHVNNVSVLLFPNIYIFEILIQLFSVRILYHIVYFC